MDQIKYPCQACPKMRFSASSCVGVSCSLPACISAGCAAAVRWNTSRTAGGVGTERQEGVKS